MHDTNHHRTSTATLARPAKGSSAELLDGLEGKGAHDVLDALPKPRLALAMVYATAGCMALLALFTVGPYLWGKHASANEEKAAATEPVKKNPPEVVKNDAKDAADKKATDKPAAVVADGKKDEVKITKDVVDRLKENDVKKDKPKDPLGLNIDDILDKK